MKVRTVSGQVHAVARAGLLLGAVFYASAVTALAATLGAPTGLNVINLTATSFNLRWAASSGGIAGSTLYDIYRDGFFIDSTTARSLVVGGLAPGTAYRMSVLARNGNGVKSSVSAVLPVTTTADTTSPTKPSGLAASEVTTNSLTLTWNAATDNVGVTSYTIFRGGIAVGSSLTTEFGLGGLAADTIQRITVRAVDRAGNVSAPSPVLEVKTMADPPSIPVGLTAGSIRTVSLVVKWNASTGGTGHISSYDVYLDGTLLGSTARRNFGVTALKPSTTYHLQITARDGAGNVSPRSEPFVVTTLPDTSRPSAPTALKASAVEASSFMLTWAAARDNIGVEGYKVYVSGVLVGSTSDTTFPVTGLSPNTAYKVSVRAIDAAGNLSTASPVLAVRTLQTDTTPPTAPTGLTVSNIRPDALTLGWSPSTDNREVTGYEIYAGGKLFGTSITTSLLVSGLLPSTSYLMQVVASDAAGNRSPPSASLLVVTLAPPNEPPVVRLTGPAGGAVFSGNVTLKLEASASDSDGNVARVEFFDGPAKLAEDLVAPFAFDWIGAATGHHLLSAVATDNRGASTASATVDIEVQAGAGLPFTANFEPEEGYHPGALDGQNGWRATGPASVVSSPVYFGRQAVTIMPTVPPAILVHSFGRSDPGVTFVDLFATPAAAAVAADGVFFETDAVQVALTGGAGVGSLQAFNGNGAEGGAWYTTSASPLLDTAGRTRDWLRVTTRTDYTARIWDLYVDGRMIAANLGFLKNSPPSLTGLSLSGHATVATTVDDLLAGFENPLFVDADKDGMEDAWESAHGLNTALNDRDADPDGDGLTNIEEYVAGTNPASADTDGDGLADARELATGTDPTRADTDGDGMPDGWELAHGLNPNSPGDASEDPDGDGLTNIEEYHQGSDPKAGETAAAPATVSGLRLWLRADRGVTRDAENKVGAWSDRSAQHRNAFQPEPDFRPLLVAGAANGSPVLRFDGENDWLEIPKFMTDATEGELWVVLRVPNFASRDQGLWNLGGADGATGERQDIGQVMTEDFGRDSRTSIGVPVNSPGEYVIYNVTAGADDWTVRLNGVTQFHSAENSVRFGENGWLGRGVGKYLDGDVAEVVVYGRMLSAEEREAVGVYLAGKYAPPTITIPEQQHLSVAPVAFTGAGLSWSAAPVGLHTITTIERQEQGGAFSVLAQVADLTTYRDSGLVPGRTYGYRLKARSLAGASPYSEVQVVSVQSGMDAWLSGPEGDLDGDGASNLQESMAGTDPANAASIPGGGAMGGTGPDPAGVFAPTTASSGAAGHPAISYVGIALESPDGYGSALVPRKVTEHGHVLLAYTDAYGGQPRGYHWFQGTFYPLRHSPLWAQAASPASPQYSTWTGLNDMNDAGFSVGSVSHYADGSDGVEYPTEPIFWGPAGGEPRRLPPFLNPVRGSTPLPAQAVDTPGPIYASVPYDVDAQGNIYSHWAPLLNWIYTASRINRAFEVKPGTASRALAIADSAVIVGSYTESDVSRIRRTDAHEFFEPASGISPALVWDVINNQWHTPSAWNYSVESKLFDASRTYTYSTSGQQHSGAIRWAQPGALPLKLPDYLTFVGQSSNGSYLLTQRSGYGYEINSPSVALAHVPDGPINQRGRFLSGPLAIDTQPAGPSGQGAGIIETVQQLPGLAGGQTIALNNYGHVLGRKGDGTVALWMWRDGAYTEWPLALNIPAGAALQEMTLSLTDDGVFLGQLTGPGREPWPALFVPAGMQVDADRDGQINLQDKISTATPYGFLLNNNHDLPDTGVEGDAGNTVVDGVRDLRDFFPVLLDLKALVAVLPPGPSIKYKLKQADGALGFVYTSLTRATAFAFRDGLSTTGYGPGFSQPAGSATVERITPSGVGLSEAFLNRVRLQDQGIILVEGRTATSQPLVLSIEQDGRPIAELSLPLQSIRVTLAVDANGDGNLKLSSEDDSDLVTGARPFPFWINQNDDTPAEAFEADFANDRVDGVADLQDFFPVFLDVKELMSVLPAGPSVKYLLRQEEGALNFVYTSLTRATAFSFRDGVQNTGFGPAFDQPSAMATTQQITAQGVELSGQFLDRIRNQNQGVILLEGRSAMSRPLLLSVEKDGVVVAEVTLGLQPQLPELGVDANRDGRIRLATDDSTDVTTGDTPFRFWLNEGVDESGAEGEQTKEPGSFGTVHDYQGDRISLRRDLEDWAAVRLSIPAALVSPRMLLPLTDPASGLVARLEWNAGASPATGTVRPTVRFVAAARPGKEYLRDAVVAAQQIEGDQGKVIGQVSAEGACAIPAGLWQAQADGRLEANLLLEGAAPGQGELTLALYHNTQRLSAAGGLHVQIRRLQDMYEHWTANADDTDVRGVPISTEPLHPLGPNPAPFEFSVRDPGLSLPSDPEGNEYILFVHGWRMKPWERRAFAETAAKRLYQLGYRGKFGFFSWPTEWVNLDVWYAAIVNALADPDHYDRAEVVARTAGHGPLARLLLNLRGKYGASHVHVFAHSMGNVVVSEALRSLPGNDPVVAQYVACQSAEVASAYEGLVRESDGTLNQGAPSASPALGGPDRYTYSAPIVRDNAGSGLTDGDNYHKGIASRLGIMVNFYNGGDSALSKWDINQKLKPDHTAWPRDTAYGYELADDPSTNPARVRDRYLEDPSGLTGSNQRHELHWDNIPERHRILAFIVQARSRATGVTKGIVAEFNVTGQVEMDTAFDFKNIHSAEFLSDAISRRIFYRQLLDTFKIIGHEK